jgi:hypothetical protein
MADEISGGGLLFEIRGYQDLLRKMPPEITNEPRRAFLEKSGITVQSEARRHSPVDQGFLRNSILYEIDSNAPPEYVKIGTRIFYAPFQEYGTGLMAESGTRPRHWPPAAALDSWAKRHGIKNGNWVAKVIGLRGGLRPRQYMRNGLRDSVGSIRGYLEEMADEIERKWEEK